MHETRWQHDSAWTGLFWIKLLHTLIFFVVSVAIIYMLASGVFNLRGPGLVVAVAIVLTEVGVFLASGMRCPLTKLARRFGDATGNDFIADIFVPERFARLIPLVCGGLALIGLLSVGVRLVLR